MLRVAVIGCVTLDTLPHNGAVVTLLAICGCTHRKSYLDIVAARIVGPIIALGVVIALGSVAESFGSSVGRQHTRHSASGRGSGSARS